jgi:ribonuclease BN (tRNA processing enzyme)
MLYVAERNKAYREEEFVGLIQLHFLGSGDAFGSGGRFQPCLRLQSGNDSILIDCGASSLSAMKREAMNQTEVGWVLISHLHGDHFAGVPFLILDGQFSKRTRPLVVAGPPGIRKRVEGDGSILLWLLKRNAVLSY